MNKVLLLGSLSKKRNRLDGVTIKTRTLLEAITNEGIKINYIDTDNWIKYSPFIIFKLLKNYRNTEVIILSSADRGAYYALKLLKMLGYKGCVYYFVAGGRLADSIKNNKYNKSVYEICKCIYVESYRMKEELIKLGLNNVNQLNNFRIISRGYSNTQQIKQIREEIRCIYFGRVIPEKGIGDAIEVINSLNSEGYNLIFDIYGQIDEQYYASISPYLNSKVKYKGVFNNDEDKYCVISQYDILLFPTKYPGECLPGTLIESYLSGLAIIASDWKYAREYIEVNKVGYIFEYENIQDFKKELKKLVDNPNTLNKFKNNSIIEGEKYNSKYVLKEFYNLLRD